MDQKTQRNEESKKKGEKTLKTSMKDRAKTLKILQEETPFSSVHTHQENDEVPRMEFNVESFSQFFSL